MIEPLSRTAIVNEIAAPFRAEDVSARLLNATVVWPTRNLDRRADPCCWRGWSPPCAAVTDAVNVSRPGTSLRARTVNDRTSPGVKVPRAQWSGSPLQLPWSTLRTEALTGLLAVPVRTTFVAVAGP